MVLVGCSGGAAQATVAPTATQVIVNPPVIKATDTAAPATPTAAVAVAAATATPAAPAATVAPTATAAPKTTGPLVVNGVTMPFDRSVALVMDQGNFAVYDSFNPLIPNGVEFAAGWWQISSEYLWYVNYATGEIIPWLADSFEYNKDYTQMTIHIHKGATWNDGQPFTAQDVAWSMNLFMKDPTLSSAPADVKYWKSVEAPDDFTVVFTFNSPRPRTHLIFDVKICTGQIILPKHIFGAAGVDVKTFKNNPPVTTGAYMLDKAYPDQKLMVWKKNPNYWNKAKFDPAPQYVIYRTGPAADQYLSEAQANIPDIFGMDYQTYQDKKSTIPNISLVAYVDPCPRGAYFNTAKAPFDKAEFRRAMSMLMNRPKWAANIWVPASKPAIAPWADYRNLDKYINQSSAATWNTLTYDPTAAMKLLTGLGYKTVGGKLIGLDGKPVAFTVGTPTGVTDKEYAMAADWIQDLQAVGITATLQHYEQPVWFGKASAGDFDAGIWWLCGATVDPDELFTMFKSSNAVPIGKTANAGDGSDTRLKDPEFDAVLAKLEAVAPDDAAAAPLYQQAYDIFMRDAPAVPLIQTYYTVEYNNQNWTGMPTNDKLYTVPFNWWAQIVFVLFKIQPAK
jgi:peptide/nickel transport system substrate-binding protein